MSESNTYSRLSKADAALLLVDHQSGLISLVQDFSPGEFKNNVLALAACGKYFELPTILTTSFENGPNGPLVPELKEMFPNAPYIARPGNINAWDNEDFIQAIQQSGRKQLIIAGVGDRSLRGIPGTVRDRGRIRGLRDYRCLRHLQRGHPTQRLVADAGRGRATDELVRHGV